jgi:hypothetical protein
VPSVRIDALGTTIDLEGSAKAVAEVARDWSRCVVADPEGEATKRLDIGQRSTPWLTGRVTREAIEGLAGRRILLHAAGLSTDDGQVLVLVGPSGTGKTTACTELCRSTFGYATDETVAIDGDLGVTAYPKPLLLRRSRATPKDVVSPDELGLAVHPDRLTAHRIVLLRRDGTSPARVEQVPLISGLLAMIRESSALARMDRPLTTLAGIAKWCGGVHALHYAEIAEAGELLRDLMSGARPAEKSWEPLDLPAREPPHEIAPAADTLHAASVHDAIRVGDEVLALRDGRPIQLRGIGSTIWTSAIGGIPTTEVLTRVVVAHDSHPDAQRLVAAAVDTMVEEGLLTRT